MLDPSAPVAPRPSDVEIGLDQYQQLGRGPLHLRTALVRAMVPVADGWPPGLDDLRRAVEADDAPPSGRTSVGAMALVGGGVGLGAAIAVHDPGPAAPVVASAVVLTCVLVALGIVVTAAQRPARVAGERRLAVESLRTSAFVHAGPDGRVVHIGVPRLALLDVTAPLASLLEQGREALAEAEAAGALRSEAAGTVLAGVVPDLAGHRAELAGTVRLLEATLDELRALDAELVAAADSAALDGQPAYQRDIGRSLVRGRTVLAAATRVVHAAPPTGRPS